MKALEKTKHKTHLINILLEIYKNDFLANLFGFKGGTALLLFYNLPRLSVDLDFDLTIEPKKEIIKQITQTLTDIFTFKNYTIKDYKKKRQTLFWNLSYGKGLAHIKVEISTRHNPFNRYEWRNLYGTQIKVLKIEDMIAHKLVAIIDRPTLASRDLFDAHYLLQTQYASGINYKIIKYRTKQYPYQFYASLIKTIKNQVTPRNVLAGLGELLERNQKDRVKIKLIPELIGYLQLQQEIFPQKVKLINAYWTDKTKGDYILCDFTFKIDEQIKHIPIKISGTLSVILANLFGSYSKAKSKIMDLYKDKINDFLLSTPKADSYTSQPITTYDIPNRKNLNEVIKALMQIDLKTKISTA